MYIDCALHTNRLNQELIQMIIKNIIKNIFKNIIKNIFKNIINFLFSNLVSCAKVRKLIYFKIL